MCVIAARCIGKGDVHVRKREERGWQNKRLGVGRGEGSGLSGLAEGLGERVGRGVKNGTGGSSAMGRGLILLASFFWISRKKVLTSYIMSCQAPRAGRPAAQPSWAQREEYDTVNT